MLEEAQVVLEKACDLSQGAEPDLVFVQLSSLWQLADVHRDLGRPEVARELLEAALAVCDEYEVGDFERFEVLYQLDYILQELGDDEEALAVQEEASRLGSGLLEDPDIAPVLAAVMIHLGNSYAQLGRKTESAEAYARAEELLVDMDFGEEHPLWYELLMLRADGLRDEGRYEEAAEIQEQMLARRIDRLGEGHPLTASAAWWLGFTRAAAGEYAVAADHMQWARLVEEEWWGADHPETWSARYFEACYRAALGDSPAAARLAERNLLAASRRVGLVLEGLAERERLAYLTQQRGSLDLLLSLRPAAGGEVGTYYHHVASWKGTVSRELARQKAALVGRPGDRVDPRVGELRELQSRIAATALGTSAASAQDLPALRRRRDALERELFGSTDHGASSAEWTRPRVPEGAALVDFLIYRRLRLPDDPDGPPELGDGGLHLAAWVVSGAADEPVRRVDLGEVERLDRLVLDYLSEMADAGLQRKGERVIAPRAPSGTPVEQTAAALREALWDPLEPLIGEARTIFLSPDGFLGRMPFEVIRDARGQFLVEQRSFVYLAAASNLDRALASGDAAPSLLLIGNLDYGSNTGTGDAGGLGPWTPLPGTLVEIEGIAELHRARYGDELERTLLQRGAATESRLREEMPRHAVVHVATHGFHVGGAGDALPDLGSVRGAAPQNPPPASGDLARSFPGVLSGIVCAPPAPDGEEAEAGDGLLTAEEMAWMDLGGVDLVVLSACSSGLGTPRLGEGMLGLRRSFRQAGARTVVSALWAVPDEETSRLMRSFYRRLWVEGESKLDALRGAQLEMLAAHRAGGDPSGRPGAWGAFVLEGAIR
jgi:CHAT domain-containing protein/tetratricopeptide (TPR) repeat protein